MYKYTDKDVIISPKDERFVEGALYYMSDEFERVIDYANHNCYLFNATASIDNLRFPFYNEASETHWKYVIRKKGENKDYNEIQKTFVEKNNLKIGDTVTITRRADSRDKDWVLYWTKAMNKTIGKQGKVKKIHWKGILVEFKDGDYWFYPCSVIEKADTRSYAERQAEWVKENNLKLGDKVKVIKKSEKDWDEDWCWVSEMDKTVGTIMTVCGIRSGAISLEMRCGKNCGYPYYCLEKVKEEPKFKVGDYVRAIDDFYNITSKRNDYIGKIQEVYSHGFVVSTVYMSFKWNNEQYTVDNKHFEKVHPREVYMKLFDKWLADNNVKEGDRFKVVRKPTEDELRMWGTLWMPSMDNNVGKIVKSVFTTSISIRCANDDSSFLYPFFVLEKVNEEPKFKAGDFIRAIDNHYCFTNKSNNFIGMVLEDKPIDSEYDIKVESIINHNGAIFDVHSSHFEKINPKEVYRELTEKWVKEKNLKIGDMVKVARSPTDIENKFRPIWIKSMERYVGQTLKVTHINGDEIGCLKNGETLSLFYPFYVLEKVEDVREPKNEFKAGDKVLFYRKWNWYESALDFDAVSSECGSWGIVIRTDGLDSLIDFDTVKYWIPNSALEKYEEKTESKYKPFNLKNEKHKLILAEKGWVKSKLTNAFYRIIFIDGGVVELTSIGELDMQTLFDDFTFLDDTPCGVHD